MEFETNQNVFSGNQKLLIIAVFLLVYGGCLFLRFFQPPVYQAKASVFVEEKDLTIGRLDQLFTLSGAKVSNIVQKLKSATLLQNILQRLNYNYLPGSEEFTKIQKKILVRSIPSSNVIEIRFSHRSAEEAVRIVNTLVDTLIQVDLKERRGKVQKDLELVQTALVQIQTHQLRPALTNKTNISSIDKFLKDVTDDLFRTEQQLSNLKSNLLSEEAYLIDNTITPLYLERFKPNLILAEKKLVANLIVSGRNNRTVQNQLKIIWNEKLKISSVLEDDLGRRLNKTGPKIINDICTYEVRRLDLQIRKQELQLLIPNNGKQFLSSEINKQYDSLKQLEEELIKQQVTLQNLNDSSLVRISWIDRAVPEFKPFLHRNILYAVGLSFMIAFIASFIAGFLLFDYNLARRCNN